MENKMCWSSAAKHYYGLQTNNNSTEKQKSSPFKKEDMKQRADIELEDAATRWAIGRAMIGTIFSCDDT